MPTRTLTFALALDGTSARVARRAVMVRVRVFFIEISNAPEGGLVALGTAVQGAMRVGRTHAQDRPTASDHPVHAGAHPIPSHAQPPDADLAVGHASAAHRRRRRRRA